MLKNVSFKKPDYNYIKENNLLAFDMHVHTKYSDGANRVTTILKKAKRLGIGVAITDHNVITGSLKAFNNHFGVPVIPGIEVTTKEGLHILLYFYELDDLEDFYVKYVKHNKKYHPYMITNVYAKDLIKAAKKYKCVIVAAHPASPTRMGAKTALKRKYIDKNLVKNFDAIEVICGSHLPYMNKKALSWAWELDKPVTAGSDAHTLLEVGKIISYADVKDYKEFLNCVLDGKNFVVGKEPVLPDHVLQFFLKMIKHLRFPKKALKAKCSSVLANTVKHYGPRVKNKFKNGFNKKLER